jgi:hypothetical protein
MNTLTERTTTLPVIRRHFEFSRHQRINLASAFEHALPIIIRRPAQEATPGHAALAPRRQRRALP